MIDLIFSIVVSLFAFRGWRLSLLLALLAILELVAGYVALYFFHKPLAALLGKLFTLQPLVAYPAGGLAAFLVGIIGVSLITHGVRRRRRQLQRRGHEPMFIARLAGALVGAAHGAALSLVVVFGLLLLQGVMPQKAPDARGSRIGQLATPWLGKLTGAVARRASDSEALSAAAARAAKDPAGAAKDLKAVVGNRSVKALMSNPRALKSLARADPESIAKHPSIRRLARDKKFVAAARRLGLLEAAAGEKLSAEEIRRQLGNRAAPLSRAVSSLARDTDVQELLKDRDLQRKLERQDIASLLNDPKFNQLAQKVLEKLRAAQKPAPAEAPDPEEK